MNAAAANLMVGHGFADVQAMQQWLLQQQQNFQLNPQASLSSMYQIAASNPLLLNGQQLQTLQQQHQQQQQQQQQQQMYYQQQINSSMGMASTVPHVDIQYIDNVQRRKSSLKHIGSMPRTSKSYSIPHQAQCKLWHIFNFWVKGPMLIFLSSFHSPNNLTAIGVSNATCRCD
jgi:hypothetical protein